MALPIIYWENKMGNLSIIYPPSRTLRGVIEKHAGKY